MDPNDKTTDSTILASKVAKDNEATANAAAEKQAALEKQAAADRDAQKRDATSRDTDGDANKSVSTRAPNNKTAPAPDTQGPIAGSSEGLATGQTAQMTPALQQQSPTTPVPPEGMNNPNPAPASDPLPGDTGGNFEDRLAALEARPPISQEAIGTIIAQHLAVRDQEMQAFRDDHAKLLQRMDDTDRADGAAERREARPDQLSRLGKAVYRLQDRVSPMDKDEELNKL